MKAKLRNSLTLGVLVATVAVIDFPAHAATPEEDFAARCAAPGVVLCNGMDNATTINAGIQQAEDDTQQGFVDTSTKASGAGSLKFRLRANFHGSNLAGAWSTPFGRTFTTGDTIYVQWRQRTSPEYYTNNRDYWNSSIKTMLIHGPSSLCQGAELAAVVNSQDSYGNWPSLYTNCGWGFNTDASNNKLCGTSGSNCTGDNILLQQGSSLTPSPNGNGYNCNYENQVPGTGDGSGCFYNPSNTWVTYYYKFYIGPFGGNGSSVDAYVAVNGGPYKQYQRATGIPFVNNKDSFFQYFRFETYMTEMWTRGKAAPVDAYVWYDELIVSTQPIAAPGNIDSIQLNAPTNLHVVEQ